MAEPELPDEVLTEAAMRVAADPPGFHVERCSTCGFVMTAVSARSLHQSAVEHRRYHLESDKLNG